MGIDTPRVLIADGDRTLRQQLYSRLLEIDIFSDCVATVDDATSRIRQHEYGLIVVDVSLPGGEIEHVIAEIAALPVQERPVVLILASNPGAARSLDVEIVQIVLRKPVALGQLVDLIRSCVRGGASRAEHSGDGDGDHPVTS